MTSGTGDDTTLELEREIARLRQQLANLEAEARQRGWGRPVAADTVREVISSSQQTHLKLTNFTVEHLADAAYWVIEDASIVYVNQAAAHMLGYSREELMSMSITQVNADVPASAWPGLWSQLKQERRRTFETRHLAKDGNKIPVEVSANLMVLDGMEFSCAFARDIRERKELELRLRQGEKMEAIGQLAGGIAHDFNNQLMGIMGYADLLSREVADDPNLAELVHNILLAVTRSAELTAQLLAFSRKGKYLSEPVDLHQIVREVASILAHSIDKRIQVQHELEAVRPHTIGDRSQLQSAVLNLALNARDAMPNGGTLLFTSENVELDGSFQSELGFPVGPGSYVKLSVTDSGTGMTPEVQRRMFEPFFTTKAKGKGTGLGLAAVYGTVKNHRGAIRIHSKPDMGSRLELFLPVGTETFESQRRRKGDDLRARQSAKIMVVEDEPQLRDVARRMLESLGYTVTTFESGDQAVRYFKTEHANVDLVILDMVMPVMSGRETFRLLREIAPNVKALLASGYSLDGDAQAILDDGVLGFIQKPYGRKALDELLRKALA
ncbi:MAG TPA: response regulator [Polyangiaceae bacterium]